MKNILFIHQSADLYGSDKTLLLLLSKLDKTRFNPIVVIPLDGPLKEELEKELKRQEGFLMAVTKKLSNEKFVSNAPDDVVAIEKKKQSDAAQRIEMLTKALQQLNK